MIQSILFFVVVGCLIWVMVTLADYPGVVSLEWAGWRIDTSFAVLLGIIAVVSLNVALAYRFFLFLRRSPRKLKTKWINKRRERGYKALTHGMVAVAAGDANEAQEQANRASALLDDPPLTLLISAQAAQMRGDEAAAIKYFSAMVDRSDTKFLGLRGLYNQAIKRGDKSEALSLARRAHRLEPKSTWAAKDLFDLQISNGQWLGAKVTTNDLQRRKLVDPVAAKRHKAVLNFQLSEEARNKGDLSSAEDYLLNSIKLAPDFVPASVNLATVWINNKKSSRAVKMIKKSWSAGPHPELLNVYWLASGAADAMEKVRVTKNLTNQCPYHLESLIALTQVSLEAELWGEARHFLKLAINKNASPPGRVCQMMAELEERENFDQANSRKWLVRASQASADPIWVCNYCGNGVDHWSAICGKCGEFDSSFWRPPPSVVGLIKTPVVDEDAEKIELKSHLISTENKTTLSLEEIKNH